MYILVHFTVTMKYFYVWMKLRMLRPSNHLAGEMWRNLINCPITERFACEVILWTVQSRVGLVFARCGRQPRSSVCFSTWIIRKSVRPDEVSPFCFQRHEVTKGRKSSCRLGSARRNGSVGGERTAEQNRAASARVAGGRSIRCG